MKRYIRAAQSTNYLILAKGVIVTSGAWGDLSGDQVHELVDRSAEQLPEDIHLEFLNYYTFEIYTEARYDLKSHTLLGDVINHEELESYLPADSLKLNTRTLTYFSVDLTASGDKTELRSNHSISPNLLQQLNKQFKVSDDTIDVNLAAWMNIDSAEFKQQFKQECNYVKNLSLAYHMSAHGKHAFENYTKAAFGICFAVIDPATQEGIVADGDDFIFTADTWAQYKKKATNIAKSRGYSSIESLIFKSIFTSNSDNSNIKDYDENTYKGERFAIDTIASVLRKYRPDWYSRLNAASQVGVVNATIEGHKLELYYNVLSTVAEPEIELGQTPGYASLELPTYSGYSDEELVGYFDDAFDEMLSQF